MARVYISWFRQHMPDLFSPRMSEWFPSAVMFLCGLGLFLNPTVMSTPGINAYDLMLKIATQPHWGWALMVLGAVRMFILLVNGAWRPSPFARAAMAFLSCFFWTALFLSFQAYLGFSVWLVSGWLAIDVMNVMRSMRDAKPLVDLFVRGSRAHDGK